MLARLPSPPSWAFISEHLHITLDLSETATPHGFLSLNMTAGFFPLRFSGQNIKIRLAPSDILPSCGGCHQRRRHERILPHKLGLFMWTLGGASASPHSWEVRQCHALLYILYWQQFFTNAVLGRKFVRGSSIVTNIVRRVTQIYRTLLGFLDQIHILFWQEKWKRSCRYMQGESFHERISLAFLTLYDINMNV